VAGTPGSGTGGRRQPPSAGRQAAAVVHGRHAWRGSVDGPSLSIAEPDGINGCVSSKIKLAPLQSSEISDDRKSTGNKVQDWLSIRIPHSTLPNTNPPWRQIAAVPRLAFSRIVSSPIRNAPTISQAEGTDLIVRWKFLYDRNLCVEFIRNVASEKFWIVQAATRCPWHPALGRSVYIAVHSVVHLGPVGHWPPFDRSNCMQPTRDRGRNDGACLDSNAPDTSRWTPPLESRVSDFVNLAPRTRSPSESIRPSLVTELWTLCPPPLLAWCGIHVVGSITSELGPTVVNRWREFYRRRGEEERPFVEGQPMQSRVVLVTATPDPWLWQHAQPPPPSWGGGRAKPFRRVVPSGNTRTGRKTEREHTPGVDRGKAPRATNTSCVTGSLLARFEGLEAPLTPHPLIPSVPLELSENPPQTPSKDPWKTLPWRPRGP